MDNEIRVVSASRDIAAPAETVFELIADPRRQPEWDGNDNLVEIITGDRIRSVGESFAMRTTKGNHRDNLVVDFEEGRRIAWRPGNEGEAPAGHEWRWEVVPLEHGSARVTHTYDWTELTDEARMPRARATQEPQLRASLDRLAALAESLA
ncbi:SRPBCC family protein [Knoellia sp. S7-12]|uniref:SRPBCC family protein n=1 Tax=Knoellia sp. S7-12 TaxID=3126698 RepID=UPI0033679B49